MSVYANNQDRNGGIIPDFPLKPGTVAVTTGAADISCDGKSTILIVTAVTCYVEQETTKTFAVAANSRFSVQDIDTIHVSGIATYILI